MPTYNVWDYNALFSLLNSVASSPAGLDSLAIQQMLGLFASRPVGEAVLTEDDNALLSQINFMFVAPPVDTDGSLSQADLQAMLGIYSGIVVGEEATTPTVVEAILPQGAQPGASYHTIQLSIPPRIAEDVSESEAMILNFIIAIVTQEVLE